MPWFKVDDTLAFHAKVVAAGNEAMGLWVRAGSWSSQQLTDGFIPDHMIAAMGGGEDRLIEVGLWTREDGGCRFHEWEQAQFTRAEIESKREAERDRKRRQRRTPGGQFTDSGRSPGGVPAGHPAGHPAGQDAESQRESHRPDPTRPDPTRPTSPNGEVKPRERGGYSPEFETFWATYPRKEAKRQAWKAWGKAIERATPERITAGARRYASDPNRSDQFTKHGSTWLNADGWEDEPLPSPAGRDNTHAAWSTPKGYDPADWLRKDNEPAFDYIDAEVVQLREIGR